MNQVKLKLSNYRVFLFAPAIILVFLFGYSLPHEVIIQEVPVLYKVIQVIDGDTIRVQMNNEINTVRLLGINTPEVQNPYKNAECFGGEASVKAKELLQNTEVYLLPDPQSSDRDKYHRLLRYVFLPNGGFVNAGLVKQGYAFNYIYEPFQYMKYFDSLEKEAKSNRLGLWSETCNYYFQFQK